MRALSDGSIASTNRSAAFCSIEKLGLMLPLRSSSMTTVMGWTSLANSVRFCGRPLSRIENESRGRSGTSRPSAPMTVASTATVWTLLRNVGSSATSVTLHSTNAATMIFMSLIDEGKMAAACTSGSRSRSTAASSWDRAHEVSDWRRAKVAKRWDDVKVDGHADEVLASVAALARNRRKMRQQHPAEAVTSKARDDVQVLEIHAGHAEERRERLEAILRGDISKKPGPDGYE